MHLTPKGCVADRFKILEFYWLSPLPVSPFADKKIKSDIEVSHTPVILLTAKNSDESKISGGEVGADSYITKPFSLKLLQLTIQNLQLPSLSAFPRPKNDNGLGIHWSTHLYGQSDEATSYFVSELARMNVKWVKLLVDGLDNRDYDRTIDELVSRDIMPIIRIYQQCNTPYNADDLDSMVRRYVEKGVYYFETYNEPNQPGESGGWCEDASNNACE